MARARHYVIPFAIFLFFTELARHLPEKAHFLYVAKTLIVGALLFSWRRLYTEIWIPTHWRNILLA
ncbi:MAG: hypothetical protein GXO17_05245, partial [Thermodesulfobacteria bacterium]|nr:hypothetical protein [Thermodesulfobacteriota bacterium]